MLIPMYLLIGVWGGSRRVTRRSVFLFNDAGKSSCWSHPRLYQAQKQFSGVPSFELPRSTPCPIHPAQQLWYSSRSRSRSR